MRPTEFIATIGKGKAGPAYFLLGPDRFLHEECRSAVVNTLPPEAREWCLADIEFQPGRMQQELQNAQQMPMLGGHAYFLFSDPADFKHVTEEDTEALRLYLEKPSPFATVVFAAAEPDRRRRFIQLLEKKTEVVELDPLGKQEAAAWACNFCQRAGIRLDTEIAEAMADKFQVHAESGRKATRDAVNLLWMRTELEKLLTARAGATRITRDDIQVIVAFREEYEIGKMLCAIAERKCAPALDLLRALLAGKTAETLLLWCIGDLFRQALKNPSREAIGRGGWSRGGLSSTWEIAPLVRRHYTREEMAGALRLVQRTDLSIKSSWKDSRLLLDLLIWQIIVGAEGAISADWGEENAAILE